MERREKGRNSSRENGDTFRQTNASVVFSNRRRAPMEALWREERGQLPSATGGKSDAEESSNWFSALKSRKNSKLPLSDNCALFFSLTKRQGEDAKCKVLAEGHVCVRLLVFLFGVVIRRGRKRGVRKKRKEKKEKNWLAISATRSRSLSWRARMLFFRLGQSLSIAFFSSFWALLSACTEDHLALSEGSEGRVRGEGWGSEAEIERKRRSIVVGGVACCCPIEEVEGTLNCSILSVYQSPSCSQHSSFSRSRLLALRRSSRRRKESRKREGGN